MIAMIDERGGGCDKGLELAGVRCMIEVELRSKPIELPTIASRAQKQSISINAVVLWPQLWTQAITTDFDQVRVTAALMF